MNRAVLGQSAWLRGRRDALSAYQSWSFALLEAVIAALGAGIAVIASEGNHDTAARVAIATLSALAPAALVFLAVYAFQLAAAPLHQRDELRTLITMLGDPRPVDVGLTVLELRRRGQSFLRGLGAPGYLFDGDAVETWTAEAVSFLSEQGETEVAARFIAASEGDLVPAIKKQIEVLSELVSATH